MTDLRKRGNAKRDKNKEGSVMNEPIKRVVEAMEQLPANVQQIVADRLVWEIKETNWDMIAKESCSLAMAEKLSREETFLDNSTREPLAKEKRAEQAEHIMESIMSKPQRGTKFLQMAGIIEERISPEKDLFKNIR